jgi:hypothetical protein
VHRVADRQRDVALTLEMDTEFVSCGRESHQA